MWDDWMGLVCHWCLIRFKSILLFHFVVPFCSCDVHIPPRVLMRETRTPKDFQGKWKKNAPLFLSLRTFSRQEITTPCVFSSLPKRHVFGVPISHSKSVRFVFYQVFDFSDKGSIEEDGRGDRSEHKVLKLFSPRFPFAREVRCKYLTHTFPSLP
jgi:hypothetical protein